MSKIDLYLSIGSSMNVPPGIFEIVHSIVLNTRYARLNLLLQSKPNRQPAEAAQLKGIFRIQANDSPAVNDDIFHGENATMPFAFSRL